MSIYHVVLHNESAGEDYAVDVYAEDEEEALGTARQLLNENWELAPNGITEIEIEEG